MGKLLAILALLAAALGAALLSEGPPRRADLTVIEPLDVHSLDPQRMSYMHDFRFANAFYEGLLRWDLDSPDFRVIPALARSWDLSPDKRTYTFHLDPAARWSNQDPVTSEDFIYSWQRALLPDTASDFSKLFFVIKGAEQFFSHRTDLLKEYAERPESERTPDNALILRARTDQAFADLVGLRAPDPHTLVVQLERPAPYFPDFCAMGTFFPVHRPTVEEWVRVNPSSGAIEQDQGWTKPPHLVTNGPYNLSAWRFKREMILDASPTYRDPSLAASRTIRVLFIENAGTAVMAYESGAADWLADTEVEYIGDMLEEIRRGDRTNLHAFPAFGTYFWSFNCTPRLTDGSPNPFADPRVRRAFAMAIDKAELVRSIRRSNERPARSLIPPGSIPGFASPEGLPFDLTRARAELAAAGWADTDADGIPESPQGKPFPVVELLARSVGPHKQTALALARMWEEAFGIKFSVAVKESKVFAGDLDRRDFFIACGNWYGDYLDPSTYLDIHRTGDGNNDRGYSDPRLDDLLARAERQADPAARLRLLEEAERYTVEESLPLVPIWFYDQYMMFQPPTDPAGNPDPRGVAGISKNPRLIQYYFRIHRAAPPPAQSRGILPADAPSTAHAQSPNE